MRQDWPAVTGYLILQLHQDYIRDRLLPKALEANFDSTSEANASYEVSIALDGKRTLTYVRRHDHKAGGPGSPNPASNHIFAWKEVSQVTARGGAPDRALPLMLSDARLPADMEPRGVAQRIWVQRHFSPGERNDLFVPPPHHVFWPAPAPGLPVSTIVRRQGGMPRLFLVGDARHKMTLEARQVGEPLGQALNRKYAGSLALGSIILLLLLAATSMVAVTLSRAALQAETRTDAAASLAHQLVTPVAAIIFLAENLADGLHEPGRSAKRYGGLITQYARRLKTIVERAMQMNSMDSNDRRGEFTLLDVGKAVEESFSDATPTIDNAGFEAECSCAEGLPMVRADAEGLRQAVGDLLNNAVKYGKPGRWVKVEAVEAVADGRREVQIRVHDRGPGIPDHEARKIFEPYYRIANEASTTIDGAGLGLKLAAETVKGMGGALTLESEVGIGSVFTIHLPVPDPEV